MIGHESVGEDFYLETIRHLLQSCEKEVTIPIIKKDVSTLISPG